MTIRSWINLILLTIFFSSCDLSPCENYPCVNGRKLVDAYDCFCLCDAGWRGIDCSIEDPCRVDFCIHGSCNPETGNCQCFTGYEGDSCQTVSIDKFLNNGAESTWNAKDTCTFVTFAYTVTLAERDSIFLNIFNLGNLGQNEDIPVNVDVNDFEQTNNEDILGNISIRELRGTISENDLVIRMSYVTEDGFLISDCTGTWTRQ